MLDDVENIRDIYTNMLSRMNYDVMVARDGNVAIELFKCAIGINRPFDAVILDLKVANGMGGEEATKRLLEIDPGAKIILSSGSIGDPVMINFEKYGISAILHKPFKFDDLKKVLEQVAIE